MESEALGSKKVIKRSDFGSKDTHLLKSHQEERFRLDFVNFDRGKGGGLERPGGPG